MATSQEITMAATQYVRKVAGFQKPSTVNEQAFEQAIHEIAHATQQLLDSLVTKAEPRNREVEAAKAQIRSAQRFGQ